MKQNKLIKYCLPLLLMTLIFSCFNKKSISTQLKNNIIEEIKNYLNQNSTQLKDSNTKDNYKALLDNLQYKKIFTLKNPKANETIYVVPLINDNDLTKSNVAVFYKYTNIEELEIVAVDNGKETSLNFKNVLTYDPNKFTGVIETKDVNGQVLCLAEMDKGKYVKRKWLEDKKVLPLNGLPCTDYFYVQYVTDAKGNEVEVASTFAYSTCSKGEKKEKNK